MKNYMKYFLLMGLVSVASAAEAVDRPEVIVTSVNPDAEDVRPIPHAYY